MKGLLLIKLLFLLFVFYACDSGESIDDNMNDNMVKRISLSIEPIEFEESHSRLSVSESIEYEWQVEDTIGVFPRQGGQVEFIIEEEDVGKDLAQFDGGGWYLKKYHSFSAYYPFNFYNRNVKEVPISYLGQVYDGNASDKRSHLRNYLFFASTPTIAIDTLLNFNIKHQGNIMKLVLKMPLPKKYTSLSVFTDEEVLPVQKTIDLTDEELPHTTVKLSNRLMVKLNNVETTVPDEEMEVWIAFPYSQPVGEHPLKVVVMDEEGNAYVGNVVRYDDKTTPANASFSRNMNQERYAAPVLDPNFKLDVTTVTPKEWEDGGEYEETVTVL